MKTVTAGMIFLVLILLSADSAFAQCPLVPLQEAAQAMVSDSEVTVTQVPATWPPDGYYILIPSTIMSLNPSV